MHRMTRDKRRSRCAQFDRDGFGPAVCDDSENFQIFRARRVQQSTAKFSCRCDGRTGTWSSFVRSEKNAATAATAATATTGLDAERARETGSSIDLDAERTRNSGRSSTDLEFDKARKQMMIGFKRMRDDDLIDEDEFYAKRKRLLNL